jgi:hypothetical protein
MSLLMIDGFEDGLSTYKWTSLNGSWAIPGSGARTGSSYLQLANTSSPPSAGFYLASDAHATVGICCGIKWIQLGIAAGVIHFLGDSGATHHVQMRVNSFGAVEIYRGGSTNTGDLGTLLASSAPGVIVVNNWYHVETKVLLSDTVGTIEVRVNGISVVTFSGDTKNAGTGSVIDFIYLGGASGTNNYAGANFDDVAIWNGAGSLNNDFLGDCSVQTLLPTGDGNYSQWVGSDGNSVNNSLLVDEPGNPNTSDYVESGTSGNKDSYAFGDLPAGTLSVKGVVIRSYAAKSDAGAQLYRNFARISGTDYAGADKGPSVTPAYIGFSDLMEISPATSTAWTPAEVNGAEFGVEAR